MRRIQLIVAYDGTDFHGFAKQEDTVTVQGTLEKAIFNLTGQVVEVIGSGRTDAGVHARNQCCVIDIDTPIPTSRLAKALNGRLPRDIVVKEARDVKADFHPRYMAKKKTYRYQILTSPVNDPFIGKYCYFYPYTLDITSMQEAVRAIEGTHDFKCFCASGSSVKNTVRTIYGVEVKQEGDLVSVDICGNGFLYNMVRIIVGTLMEIGRGKLPKECFKDMIEKRDRTLGGPTAPPEGLTLVEVDYDDHLRYKEV